MDLDDWNDCEDDDSLATSLIAPLSPRRPSWVEDDDDEDEDEAMGSLLKAYRCLYNNEGDESFWAGEL